MATTINNYSVGLSLNASDYIKNSILSRSETARLKKEIEGARTPAEVYANKLGLIDKALREGAIEQSTYNRLLDSAKQKLDGAAKSTSNYLASLKSVAAAYVSMSAAKSVIGDSIKLASEAESAGIQFEVLTGSVEGAARMVQGLRDLAATTPLNVTDTQKAARTMLSFGVSAESILPTLKQLGDVTGGNSQRFEMMALAFAQVSAAGRLMGQDLLQMVNAGFNPLQEISRKTGESLVQLKKRMEDGGISSREVADALRSATSEGGLFFGMIDRMSETTEGKMAKMRDTIDSIKRDLGEGLLPVVNKVLDSAAEYARLFRVGSETIQNGGLFASNRIANEQNAMAQMEEQMRFANEQIARRRAGMATVRTQSSLDATKATADAAAQAEANRAISGGIESAITNGIEALKTGSGGIIDMLRVVQDSSASLAQVGIAHTKELTKTLKDDPAVKALEAGTQEAYQAMTKLMNDADKQSRLEAIRQKELAENARLQRDKMNQMLEKINEALENNGFKRIR